MTMGKRHRPEAVFVRRRLIPAAVEFDVPSRLSAQASNGHPSNTCGGRWPGLSPGHDGKGESRSTAAGITAWTPRRRLRIPRAHEARSGRDSPGVYTVVIIY